MNWATTTTTNLFVGPLSHCMLAVKKNRVIMFDLKLQKISIPFTNAKSNEFRLIKIHKYNLHLQSQIDFRLRWNHQTTTKTTLRNTSAYMLAVKNSQIFKPLIRLPKKSLFCFWKSCFETIDLWIQLFCLAYV